MITIKEYCTPSTIEQSYDLLKEKKNAVLFGGGAFIRMGSKNINTAIDLSKAGLDYINEDKEYIKIGAMTTFGDIEHSDILKTYFNNTLAKSVREIVGIQLRNLVTVGGTVYSRYGFSDFITGLLPLNVKVNLYKQGRIDLDEFLKNGTQEKDILESIWIPKENRKATFTSMRNSKGDYAILNVGVSSLNKKFKIAIGARPERATFALDAMDYLNYLDDISEKNIIEAAKIASEETHFGTNSRGSAIYRKHICYVLVKRALEEVLDYES